MTDSSPPAVMRRLNEIWAFALAAIPLLGAVFAALWWMHGADSAHALRHAGVEDRVVRVEAAIAASTKKTDDMARDIRGIMIAVGAERATREALHSTSAHPHQSRGLLQSLPGAEGE